MEMRVLVAYGSKYGATAEIAGRIGQVLGGAGLPTDVLPAVGVRDLTPYRAVVLGSAVYMGLWRRPAANLLKTHEQTLSSQLVWLFSSGPMGEGNPLTLTDGWRLPASLQPIANRIRPRDIAVFHGKADVQKLNPFEKWIMKKVKAPHGDFRDWDAIASWATRIADELKQGDAVSQ